MGHEHEGSAEAAGTRAFFSALRFMSVHKSWGRALLSQWRVFEEKDSNASASVFAFVVFVLARHCGNIGSLV